MCTRPITGYRSLSGPSALTGKWPVVFNVKLGYMDMPVRMPCGRCIECLQKKRLEWATRCVHEASLYEENRFVTLTYDNAHLPEDGNIDKKDLQNFLKRLRKEKVTDENSKIRYFGCGEYGKTLGRPHYHLALFNCSFRDEYLHDVVDGHNIMRSPELEEYWKLGFSTIGTVTWQSASYIAKYICKKQYGESAEGHYKGRKPEFAVMSLKPGLGTGWWDKWKKDAQVPDKVYVNKNIAIPVPKYYNNKWERESEERYKEVLKDRHRKKEVRSDEENRRIDKVKIIKSKKLKERRLECQ